MTEKPIGDFERQMTRDEEVALARRILAFVPDDYTDDQLADIGKRARHWVLKAVFETLAKAKQGDWQCLYEMAASGRAHFRTAYTSERKKNRIMRHALEELRVTAIPAGAAFVRGNEDRVERITRVLDIIDDALAPEAQDAEVRPDEHAETIETIEFYRAARDRCV